MSNNFTEIQLEDEDSQSIEEMNLELNHLKARFHPIAETEIDLKSEFNVLLEDFDTTYGNENKLILDEIASLSSTSLSSFSDDSDQEENLKRKFKSENLNENQKENLNQNENLNEFDNIIISDSSDISNSDSDDDTDTDTEIKTETDWESDSLDHFHLQLLEIVQKDPKDWLQKENIIAIDELIHEFVSLPEPQLFGKIASFLSHEFTCRLFVNLITKIPLYSFAKVITSKEKPLFKAFSNKNVDINRHFLPYKRKFATSKNFKQNSQNKSNHQHFYHNYNYIQHFQENISLTQETNLIQKLDSQDMLKISNYLSEKTILILVSLYPDSEYILKNISSINGNQKQIFSSQHFHFTHLTPINESLFTFFQMGIKNKYANMRSTFTEVYRYLSSESILFIPNIFSQIIYHKKPKYVGRLSDFLINVISKLMFDPNSQILLQNTFQKEHPFLIQKIFEVITNKTQKYSEQKSYEFLNILCFTLEKCQEQLFDFSEIFETPPRIENRLSFIKNDIMCNLKIHILELSDFIMNKIELNSQKEQNPKNFPSSISLNPQYLKMIQIFANVADYEMQSSIPPKDSFLLSIKKEVWETLINWFFSYPIIDAIVKMDIKELYNLLLNDLSFISKLISKFTQIREQKKNYAITAFIISILNIFRFKSEIVSDDHPLSIILKNSNIWQNFQNILLFETKKQIPNQFSIKCKPCFCSLETNVRFTKESNFGIGIESLYAKSLGFEQNLK
ncbi:DNA annealing helicase and endonuclease zranb3 [Anaeramoeba ignava]|uniref:DNA annealing helicase and endonuclease zranb3 n=1 Tax=Anaeramoeba ignava TaxID=1746090 RepID=A0A9Q0L5I6_ANAIG|nr:DNA annealing helicase and endonuclease zranb3 [Anaeramoeba ignava]